MRIALLLLLPGLASSAAADEAAMLARGRELTAAYVRGDTDSVFAQMDPGMQRFVRGKDGFAKWRASAVAELGAETEVLSETVRNDSGYSIYERTSHWSKVDEPWLVRWEIATDGRVQGFGVQPQRDREPAPTRHLDYVTKARLRLPFDGEWFTYWGGRMAEQNIHVYQVQQRFAYDFTVARAGRRFAGRGESVSDYYCWDTPVLSPSAGTVVATVTDLADQAIGARDGKSPAGNHVILDLGNGEFAILAHLRQGSVRVKPGDAVRAGDELGRCGNSGNTSEPHLHFHLQDSAKLGAGAGLPALFVDYVADGKPVARGEPTKGQSVRVR